NAEGRAALQGEAASVVPRKDTERQRAEPHAENHGRDRQGRKPLVGREHRADDAGGGNDHRIVAARKRPRGREPERVAARERVIGLDMLERFGGRRHWTGSRKRPLVAANPGNCQCPPCRAGLSAVYRLRGARTARGVSSMITAPGWRMLASLASVMVRAPIW